MFMQKIEMAAVTCDLFAVTKGFDGNGGAGVDSGKGPRTATEAEARAYADFIRRKCGAPDLGKPEMHTAAAPGERGRRSYAFHYVGATYGEALTKPEWDSERREMIPAEYAPGAFSVLFPGANQMRAKVTLETLGDAGEVVSSQTMPVDPKKGGVVWSKDDVRKACGPVAKVKAARTPTRIRRNPTPVQSPVDADKRRRAVMLALKLRAELRRMRAATSPAPDAPAMAPDAILIDLAAAEALMRGDGYTAPAPVYAKPERVRIRSTVIGNLQYGRLQEEAFVIGQAGGFDAMTGSDPAAWHYQREGRSTAYGDGFPTREDALAALDSFLASLDAPEALPVTPEPAPTGEQVSKRTPAHERAIRRAWDARKARRVTETHLRIGTGQYEHLKAELERVKSLEECTRRLASEMSEESAKRLRVMEDRLRLAEQEAAEALAMREDMKRMLAAAEQRLAAAEAENAQLWAEIETLTAPVTALAA